MLRGVDYSFGLRPKFPLCYGMQNGYRFDFTVGLGWVGMGVNCEP